MRVSLEKKPIMRVSLEGKPILRVSLERKPGLHLYVLHWGRNLDPTKSLGTKHLPGQITKIIRKKTLSRGFLWNIEACNKVWINRTFSHSSAIQSQCHSKRWTIACCWHCSRFHEEDLYEGEGDYNDAADHLHWNWFQWKDQPQPAFDHNSWTLCSRIQSRLT